MSKLIIKIVKVENFRCLNCVEIPIEKLTVLVGSNGTGKSCFLKALELFYKTDINYSELDFYNENIGSPIIISITYSNLTEQELQLFNPYLDGAELTIVKEITHPQSRDSQKYYGSKLYNPDFDAFRQASGTNLRRQFEELRQEESYSEFPSYQNRDIAEGILRDWELANPDSCERRRDDGQFFGFRNVGRARLERFTKFCLIPAVHEASLEATETRGSIISEIMEVVVRSALLSNPEYVRLQEIAQEQYERVINPDGIPELLGLERELSNSLQQFVVDSEVDISWESGLGVKIDPPRAFVQLTEDGFRTSVSRTGHGLQRAFLMSLFQYLAIIQTRLSIEQESAEVELPHNLSSLIVGIEEPELYQHPDRQRHFSKTLVNLTRGGIPGVISNIQAIYCTHSPLMIEPDLIDNIRIFRKIAGSDDESTPKVTEVTYTTLTEIASDIGIACGLDRETYSGESLRPRLTAIMTPQMNESYFAKLVVLVEGIKDQAILLGCALSSSHDFESKGISVIYCNGKCNIDRPLAILKRLKIPYYVVFDSDRRGRHPRVEANHELLRLLESERIEDYPSEISESFACFETNMEKKLRDDIGLPLYQEILGTYCEEYGLGDIEPALSIPNTLKVLFEKARSRDVRSQVIEEIVNRINVKYESIR
jgi:hypothetical protein